MAKPFILDVNLRIQQVLGLASVKQQLASVQTGGVGQVQKLPAGFKTASQAASLLAANTAKASKAVNTLGSSAKKTGAHLGTAAKKAQNFGDQIFLAGKRYGAFLAATVVAFKAIQLISAGTKTVIEFDQAMVSLSQIIGKPIDQLGDLSQKFLDLSVATGTSAADIANAAKLLAQAGFRGNQLTEAVEQLAKVPLTPIFENMEQAVDGAVAAMRQFSDEGLTVEDVFDKMIKVSDKYAASFPDIIEGIKRGGAAFQAIGGNLDEFIAAFTTIRSETREAASAVGTSLKTLSSRLADPKIIKFLETKGIRLIEKGQFVEPLEAMRRIGQRLGEMQDIPERTEIAVKLGGRRQISRFIALAKNMEKNNRILEDSKNSSKEFSKVTEQGLQAVGKQVDILVAKAKKLAIELGADLFIPFIKGLTGTADAAIALLGVLKPILPLIAQISTFLAGAAIFKGVSGFAIPKLAQLAGPAAFSAAGGGSKGVKAGFVASPFAQAGVLIAAAELVGAFTKTTEGAETFASTLITSTAMITAGIALFRKQTIAQFAMGGGLLPSLAAKGGLGAAVGTIATLGAIAVPIALIKANKSAKELSDKIVESAIQSIANIEIDPIDAKSVEKGLADWHQIIVQSAQKLIDSADVSVDPSFRKSARVVARTMGKVVEGNFAALISYGGLSQADVESHMQELIKKSPQLVGAATQGVISSISAGGRPEGPLGERERLIEMNVAEGYNTEQAIRFADAIIKAAGGLDEWSGKVREGVATLQDEIDARTKMTKLTKGLVPSRLVGQLSRFSKAVDETTRTISTSAQLFNTQIALIAGGIQVPTFEFDFGTDQVKQFIRGGGLDEIFAFTPDIPRFVGAFAEIEDLLDNFIINISNLPVGVDLPSAIEKFFDLQNVPQVVRDNFEKFFSAIAGDIRAVSEGAFIDAGEIKKRFKKEYDKLGANASDAAVESITGFLDAVFAQIQNELNRLATVRKFELAAPVRPETQAAFLEKQLKRVDITAPGGRRPVNVLRGTLEELDLMRREIEAGIRAPIPQMLPGPRRGLAPGERQIPGLLPTPPSGFFQGKDQRLADIAGDEKVRQRVRDSFQEIIMESANLKKKLAELKPGAEGFISAAARAKELGRATIELQTTLEALDQATQQGLDSEKRTLALRQELEMQQAQARVAERVRTGALGPQGQIRAERILSDLAIEQQKEQMALQDKFETIIEKDNMLRVNLAKEISESTKTQAEVTKDFDLSVNTFADATRLQVTATDLMKQYILDFGQAVVDFSNISAIQQTMGENGARITPTQIEAKSVTEQQGLDELNRLINEGNASQEVIVGLLEAISENSRPVEQAKVDVQKEQERNTGNDEKINKLTESLDNLQTVLKEPNELRLITDQHIDLDLSTLPSDISTEIRPILERAALAAARVVTQKALTSLAAKSEPEASIAALDVAQELD